MKPVNCYFCDREIQLNGVKNPYIVDELVKYGPDRYFCDYGCVLGQNGCDPYEGIFNNLED